MSCISPLCISLHYSRLDSHWCASSKTISQLLALASALLALASLIVTLNRFLPFLIWVFACQWNIDMVQTTMPTGGLWPRLSTIRSCSSALCLNGIFCWPMDQWHLALALILWQKCMSPGFHSIHFVGTAKQLKRLSENSNDLECWLGTPMVACRSSCVLLVRRPLRKRRTSSQAPGVIHGAINSVSSQHRTSCLVHGGRSTFGSTRPHCKEAIPYGFLSACAEKVWLGRYIAIGVAFCDAVLFGMFG